MNQAALFSQTSEIIPLSPAIQPVKHFCSCKKVAVNFCSHRNCSAWLCRKHSFRWHQGLDFCLLHRPVNTLGLITVGSVRHYDLTDGIYIGREVKTNKDFYPASLLGNPYRVTDKSTDEDKERSLINYKSWLFYEHIKAEDEVFEHLLNLRDMVLRGVDVKLLCWCKDELGGGLCHGDIVKAALEWLIRQSKGNK